jgi:hypothetical protein
MPCVRPSKSSIKHPARSDYPSTRVAELALVTVGAVDDDLFGIVLLDDSQVGTPTAGLLLCLSLLAALLATQH